MYNLGIDLGGTKTALGLVDKTGEICFRHSFPSISGNFDKYFSSLEKEILIFLEKVKIKLNDIQAVGVGCAGQIELETGLVFHSPNLGWNDAPLGQKLQGLFPNRKITIDNDVRAATLGEYLFGMEKRPSIYINVFLGTGIGSGIIIHDRILRGHSNSAGEIGQTSIQFEGPIASCGNHGVYEYYGSGTALGRMGIELYLEQKDSGVKKENQLISIIKTTDEITGKLIGELALKGNSDALSLVQKLATAIGTGLANIINFLNPQTITYGGGLTSMGEILTSKILETTKERAIPTAFEKTTILPVKLGDDSGIIGAAWLNLIQENGEILEI